MKASGKMRTRVAHGPVKDWNLIDQYLFIHRGAGDFSVRFVHSKSGEKYAGKDLMQKGLPNGN
mgnify:CR=1 FL=1